VLHGLGEIFVESHGLPPGNNRPPAIAAGLGSYVVRAGEVALRYIDQLGAAQTGMAGRPDPAAERPNACPGAANAGHAA
jgi:hypothetical protein